MASHPPLDAQEAADRLALRELFDAYAHCADRRDGAGQQALFTPDAVFEVCMSGEGTEPTYTITGRDNLAPVFEDLKQYEVTTHFNGQQTVVLDGDHASGESYTLAHHVSKTDTGRTMMVASLRYEDEFTKLDGEWLFSKRRLILDWMDTRPLN